jgi:hypothetical protein
MKRKIRILKIWVKGKLPLAKRMKSYQFGIDFYFCMTGRRPKGKFYMYPPKERLSTSK